MLLPLKLEEYRLGHLLGQLCEAKITLEVCEICL